MTHVTCTQHGPGCERIHVGMRVAVFGRPADTGTVIEIIDDRHFMVRFDAPYAVADGVTAEGPLAFIESELVELTHEGAMMAIVTEVLADPLWTARVVAAAVCAEYDLTQAARVPAQDVVLSASNVLHTALTKKGN